MQNIVRQDSEHAHIPDYAMTLDRSDIVTFINRSFEQEAIPSPALTSVRIDPEAYHDARTVAPGWDVYVLEHEWRAWMADCEMDPPRNPGRAFVGFCKRWSETRGRP